MTSIHLNMSQVGNRWFEGKRINENYEEVPRDTSDDYGLLKGFISVDVDGHETPSSFLAYKVYRKSDAPDT